MSGSSFDTGRQHLADVSAKALLGAAHGAGAADAVLDELGAVVSEVLDRAPEWEAILVSPRVDENEKAAQIDKVLEGRISTTLLNFIKVMARHGRLDCLRATLQTAQHLHNDARGRREVHVTTAEQIGPETIDMIAARLRAALHAEVDLHLSVDPQLIGGLVVRVGDTVFDGSVANGLARFREESLTKATLQMRASLNRFLASA